MTQNTFTFDVNIERLNPFTGQLLCVDRMTSDYAQAHPFDVDGYLKQVADKHGADYQRVREFFYYPLQGIDRCPAKHRDKVVKDPKTGIGQIEFGKWPSFVNGCEPAIIEAWNEGAKFATKGFKYGDTLPDRLPMCKITRLEDGGWIALFPKDKHLLEQPCEIREEVVDEPITSEPIIEQPKPKRKARKAKKQDVQQLDLFAPAATSESNEQSDMWMKIGAGVATAAIALILINTIGLFGIAALGLIAGGLVR